MRKILAVLAGLAFVFIQMAMAQLAPAHAEISGKYAFIQTEMCEGQITTTTMAVNSAVWNGSVVVGVAPVTVVTGVNVGRNGLMAVGNGYLTFTPTSPGGTSGSVVASGTTLIEGGSIRTNSGGFAMHQISADGNTTYSYTTTTFTIEGKVYKMSYADRTAGVPRTFFLVYLDATNGNGNPNCLISIAATKQ